MTTLKQYNRVVRQIALNQSAQFGINTPEFNVKMVYWIRRIRRELPYREQKEVA